MPAERRTGMAEFLNRLSYQPLDAATLEGYRITRLQHGLQSATRAERDGADIDWIVGALLHDIGDGLAPQNHDRFSAEVIRPFVRWDVAWVVEHHGIFQMLYYVRASLWLGPQRTRQVPRSSLFRQLRRVLRALGSIQFRPRLRHSAAGPFRADAANGFRAQGL